MEIRLTLGEYRDVQRLAQEWGETPQKVVWFIVAEYLSKCRRRNMKDVLYAQEDLNSIDRIESIVKAIEDGAREADEEPGSECEGGGLQEEPADTDVSA